jgi:hypothetical protein
MFAIIQAKITPLAESGCIQSNAYKKRNEKPRRKSKFDKPMTIIPGRMLAFSIFEIKPDSISIL